MSSRQKLLVRIQHGACFSFHYFSTLERGFSVPWCNGSTSDFLSEYKGSTPLGTKLTNLFLYDIIEKMKLEEAYRISEEETSFNKLSEPIVYVYNNEGALPHLHYKFKNGTEGCIRLDISRYFCHEKYHEGLNSSQRKMLIVFLNTDNNWQKLVDEWNRGRNQYICTATKMPDYNLLPPLQPDGKLAKKDRL